MTWFMHWSGGVAGDAPTVAHNSLGIYSGICGIVTAMTVPEVGSESFKKTAPA